MAVLDGLKYVLQRNSQYFKQYKFNSFLLTLLVVTNIVLACLLFVGWKPTLKPQYIVTDSLGNMLWNCPLDNTVSTEWQKNYCSNQLSNAKVEAFAKNAMLKVWSLDYVNYQSEMAKASRYFTKNGWATYARAFVNSGNLDNILGKSDNLKPKILRPEINNVQITGQGISSSTGRYTWIVKMNLVVNQLNITQWYNVVVQRESVENYPDRLSIVRAY